MFTLWPQFLVSNYIFSYFIPFSLTACIICMPTIKNLSFSASCYSLFYSLLSTSAKCNRLLEAPRALVVGREFKASMRLLLFQVGWISLVRPVTPHNRLAVHRTLYMDMMRRRWDYVRREEHEQVVGLLSWASEERWRRRLTAYLYKI